MRTILFLVSVLAAACGPGARDDDFGGDDDDSGPTDPPPGEKKQCNQMDIVFVVDDSGSMGEEQSNLAANFPMFAQVLSTYTTPEGELIDYRVAVTTTGRDTTISVPPLPPITENGDEGEFRNNCGMTKRYLEPTDANMSGTLACRANVGTQGPGIEMPLLMSKWALSERILDGTNAGFLRDEALLGVVYLTDENDTSNDTPNLMLGASELQPNWHPADQVEFFDQLKGHRSRWAAGVIAGDGNCTSSFGDAVDAVRLKEFVNLANGNGTTQATFSSICSGDLTSSLQNVLATFQAACNGIIL